MVVLRVEHRVDSYEAWKQAFDADPLDRRGSGVTGYRILRSVDDPNLVAIDLELRSADEAAVMKLKLAELWTRVDVMRDPSASAWEIAAAEVL